MTADEFRALALSLPEVSEGSHMRHADFRVGGKIFASLGYPDSEHAMVILPPEMQAEYVATSSAAFAKAGGAWGEGGSTKILLATADAETVSDALEAGWRQRAPKRLTAKPSGQHRH